MGWGMGWGGMYLRLLIRTLRDLKHPALLVREPNRTFFPFGNDGIHVGQKFLMNMLFIINFNYICESFLHDLLELVQLLGIGARCHLAMTMMHNMRPMPLIWFHSMNESLIR